MMSPNYDPKETLDARLQCIEQERRERVGVRCQYCNALVPDEQILAYHIAQFCKMNPDKY